MKDDAPNIPRGKIPALVAVAGFGFITAYCLMLYRFHAPVPTPVVQAPEPFRARITQIAPVPQAKAAAVKPFRRPKRVQRAEKRFDPIVREAARRHALDPALVKAIILAESSYDHQALSSRGAAGLMQLMPSTAEALGVADRFNPQHNIEGGVRYFKQLMVRFEGDTRMALAAYNAGSRKVRQYQGVPPFKATQGYIRKVMRYYDLYKQQVTGIDQV
jgi:soluble lytic murein transglycosylase-like protein